MKPLLLIFLLFEVVAFAQTQTSVVPGGLSHRYGNATSGAPFHMGEGNSARFQQVFDASEFSHAGADALVITSIRFRRNPFDPNLPTSGDSFISILPDIQFNLSTTLRAPDGLSTTFAENIGMDDTQVIHRGPLGLQSVGGVLPEDFEIVVEMDTPFIFRPATGNLLLDIRNYDGGVTTFFNGQSVVGDSVSSLTAYTGSDTGTVESESGVRSTFGYVTLFEFTPIPEPSSVALVGMAVALVVGLRFKRFQQ